MTRTPPRGPRAALISAALPPAALLSAALLSAALFAAALPWATPALAQCEEAASLLAPLESPDAPADALADVPLDAPLEAELSPARLLRALSLDLRGRAPSPADYARLAADGGRVTDAHLDELIADEGFAAQVMRHHEALLWGNLSNLQLYNNRAVLGRTQNIYWRNDVAQTYRGGRVMCLDEPATFTARGALVTRPVDGANLEGWVWVSPYWDPANPIKVCAFDAQDALYSPAGAPCGTAQGMNDAACGCGPELRWCATNETRAAILTALAESMRQLVRWVFAEGGGYLDLFTAQRLYVNGPLTHFLRHHLSVTQYTAEPSPFPTSALPDLPFSAAGEWRALSLSRAHAGVLTHPAFLLRFQTNRARANRFFDAFLCSPFQPPDGGIPVPDEESQHDPDLQERAVCKYCHALLEPAGAYWGRWKEQGFAYLPPAAFPATRADCVTCARTGQGCTDECRAHYLTSALSRSEEPFLGSLKAYTFRRPEHAVNVEQGPRLLALAEVTGERLPRCVVRRTAEWLLGRALGAGDERWLDALALRFTQEGFNYRALVSAIARDERYRRVK